jgi:two-component system sensor histidine kinase VicK
VPRFGVSIRWWLALAFALIAAVTAFAIAWVFSARASGAFRERAKELFAGTAFVAAEELTISIHTGVSVRNAVEDAAGKRGVAMVLVDRRGRPLARGGALVDRPLAAVDRHALERALAGRRVIRTVTGGEVLVAMPLRTDRFGALLMRGPTELPAELGIVRERILEATLFAIVVGVLAGLIVSALISMRLRRIAAAASAIAQGDFDQPLQPRFRDEVGSLAETVNRMRAHLQSTFAELASQRDRLHRLLDRLPEGVVTLDAELTVLFANSEAARLVPGLRHGEPLPEPWRVTSLRTIARTLFEPLADPIEQRIAPDDEHIYQLIAIPTASQSDYAIIVLADVSARERLERAEREFVANASHELRTPLTTILGAVEALQGGANDEARDRQRFIDLIDREARRLARLVRALLVLARAQTQQEPASAESIELRRLLEELAEHASVQPGVEVAVSCPADLRVLTDPDLLEQALRNLVDNAGKFTAEGRILLEAERRDGSVVISVSDTGRGIDLASQRKIFDRFHRIGGRNAEGFGLGLALVDQAVRVLGGQISLRSAPGSGTTVSIALPGAAPKELAA